MNLSYLCVVFVNKSMVELIFKSLSLIFSAISCSSCGFIRSFRLFPLNFPFVATISILAPDDTRILIAISLFWSTASCKATAPSLFLIFTSTLYSMKSLNTSSEDAKQAAQCSGVLFVTGVSTMERSTPASRRRLKVGILKDCEQFKKG